MLIYVVYLLPSHQTRQIALYGVLGWGYVCIAPDRKNAVFVKENSVAGHQEPTTTQGHSPRPW